MKRFEGKVVLITGAIGGLGMAQAKVFAEEGASLALNYIDVGTFKEDAAKFIAELEASFGGTHKAYAADITKEEEVENMMAAIVADFGHLDVLVNNAGVSINASSWKYSAEAWDKVLNVNLTGAFYCAKHALVHMREKKYGRILTDPKDWKAREKAVAGMARLGYNYRAVKDAIEDYFAEFEEEE